MSSVDELSKANTDGTRLGQSTTDKISFFGVTPAVQPSSASQATTSFTVTQCSALQGYGAATSTQMQNLVNLANALSTALVALGLIKGSA